MKKNLTIITCDWCKKEVNKAQDVKVNDASFDICDQCVSEIINRLTSIKLIEKSSEEPVY